MSPSTKSKFNGWRRNVYIDVAAGRVLIPNVLAPTLSCGIVQRHISPGPTSTYYLTLANLMWNNHDLKPWMFGQHLLYVWNHVGNPLTSQLPTILFQYIQCYGMRKVYNTGGFKHVHWPSVRVAWGGFFAHILYNYVHIIYNILYITTYVFWICI